MQFTDNQMFHVLERHMCKPILGLDVHFRFT